MEGFVHPAPVQSLTFGTFRLLPEQYALFDGQKAVRLGSRALEILMALVARKGELVTKEELFRLVWPDTAVEENNLRVHIAALRKVLGDGQAGARYIENVPGRGYRFVATLGSIDTVAVTAPPERPHSGAGDLPAPIVRLIGRAEVVQGLSTQLLQRRLVTLVAPGGTGKTTVALAIADAVSSSYRDGVRFVDFASLVDWGLVPSVLASALALPVTPENQPEQINAFLARKQMLLVLDNCERVAEDLASLVEGVLRAAPGVHVLVTSRERLQAQGEWVIHLPALEYPRASPTLTAAIALDFPAVQLFVERASEGAFELSDSDAPLVADICRRLEGNPLAIELAAARVGFFGITGLAKRLDAQFSLLMKGRRTALPRHRTLLAMLDWSYETLSSSERLVLRRLSVFKGSFLLESAVLVASGEGAPEPEVLEGVIGLVSKSLLVADASGSSVRYRLLEITREYARGKLAASFEHADLLRRHAEHFRDLVARAEQQLPTQSPDDWLAVHRWQLDDVRAALDWAFAPGGDTAVGVALTVSSVPLWFRAALMHEYRAHVEKALERVKAEASDPTLEMRLSVALGPLLMHTTGPILQMTSIVERALELSQGLSAPLRMQAIGANWVAAIGRADYPTALRLARLFGEACAEAPSVASGLVFDRMMALPLHFSGEHRAAHAHAARVLAQPAVDLRLAYNTMSHVDQQVSMLTLLARAHWLQGFPDRALATIRACVERAHGLNHATSLCFALAIGACPIGLWCGDTSTARLWTDALIECANGHSLSWWTTWGHAYDRVLASRAGVSLGAPPLAATRGLGAFAKQTDVLATLGQELLDLETVARAERGVIGWCAAEVSRAHGATLLEQKLTDGEASAEAKFRLALELSAEQGALSWELRAATSLSHLWLGQARKREAHALLSAVMARFSEGFGTTDWLSAQALLKKLEAAR